MKQSGAYEEIQSLTGMQEFKDLSGRIENVKMMKARLQGATIRLPNIFCDGGPWLRRHDPPSPPDAPDQRERPDDVHWREARV